MSLRRRRILIGAVALLTVAAGGAALATGKSSRGNERSPVDQAGSGVLVAGAAAREERGTRDRHPRFGEAAAEYLGLTREQLVRRLAQGQSLADIAGAQGKYVDGLKDAILDGLERKLQEKVDSGDLTAQQKSRILGLVRSHLDAVVNGSLPRFGHDGGRMGPPGFGSGLPGALGEYLAPVTRYLGLTTDQLLTRLRNGQSLADVAKAQGKSVDGLKDVILDAASEALQDKVDAGEMTPQQRSRILQFLRARLDDIVNGKLPRLRGFGGPHFGPDGMAPPAFGLLGPFGKRLAPVARYLGLTTAQLLARLRNGQSLADVARARGKSVDGLKDAILDAASEALQEKVEAGTMTTRQKSRFLEVLRSRLDDIVDGKLPRLGEFGGRHFGPGGGMGPPSFGPPGGFDRRWNGPPSATETAPSGSAT